MATADELTLSSAELFAALAIHIEPLAMDATQTQIVELGWASLEQRGLACSTADGAAFSAMLSHSVCVMYDSPVVIMLIPIAEPLDAVIVHIGDPASAAIHTVGADGMHRVRFVSDEAAFSVVRQLLEDGSGATLVRLTARKKAGIDRDEFVLAREGERAVVYDSTDSFRAGGVGTDVTTELVWQRIGHTILGGDRPTTSAP